MTDAEQQIIRGLTDALSRLTGKVGSLSGQFEAQETARIEAKRDSDARWERMQNLTDKIFERLEQMALAYEVIPERIDEKIAACRTQRERGTSTAQTFASDVRTYCVVLLKLATATGVVTGAIFAIKELLG